VRNHRAIMQLLRQYGGDTTPQQNQSHEDRLLFRSGMQQPQLTRSASTPQTFSQPILSVFSPNLHNHQRHVSDSDTLGTPSHSGVAGLSLPRPHTVASPAASSSRGGVRFGASQLHINSRSEPSTPDSNGYVTARNSEVKAEGVAVSEGPYRVLSRQRDADHIR